MDQDLAKSGLELSKKAGEFLAKLTPSSEIKEAMGDHVRFWRWKRTVRMLERAQEFASQHEIDINEIPTRTLFPLLEKAQNEDDDEMTDRWAKLLVSAADDPDRVPASFPAILAELSPKEVQILDLVKSGTEALRAEGEADWADMGITQSFAMGETGLDEIGYQLAVHNLVRLRLCRGPWSKFAFLQESPDRRFESIEIDPLILTKFGRSFTDACQPPAGE